MPGATAFSGCRGRTRRRGSSSGRGPPPSRPSTGPRSAGRRSLRPRGEVDDATCGWAELARCGSAARQMRTVPIRLTSSVRSRPRRSPPGTALAGRFPAALTTARANRFLDAWRTGLLTLSSAVTSQCPTPSPARESMPMTRQPSSASFVGSRLADAGGGAGDEDGGLAHLTEASCGRGRRAGSSASPIVRSRRVCADARCTSRCAA